MTKKRIEARPSDAAGIGPYARQREHLVPLSDMRGWNVIDGEADIRSWEVRTVSGRVLGSVRELLVDPRAGEVVLIDLDLAGSPDHAYVPLRTVEIDRTRRVVRADSGDLEVAGSARESLVANRPVDLADRGSVRYAGSSAERVIERRPIVEETVVRRRDVEEPDSRP
ncbi:MAG TPA: PRC-barrel domain-containing protein [Gemmatimonadaceae bacterium]|nr:PRC-barrel domain-containing protein [Gemmatimonadaceae bacterium]